MNRLESSSSSVTDKFKSILALTGAAVFGVIGYDIAAETGVGIVGKIASVIGGAFIGKKLTEAVVN